MSFNLGVLFAHLLATCLALGLIMLTDARLLAKVLGYRVVIPPPSRFETRGIMLALLLLVASGAALIALAEGGAAAALTNPKLQAKLMLVAVLGANAFALHFLVFPTLERAVPVRRWSGLQRTVIASVVGVSNGLWLYCAFLGIARPWNHSVPTGTVLAIGGGVCMTMALTVRLTLGLAARDEPEGKPDWVDSMKATLSGLSSDHVPLAAMTRPQHRHVERS
jgi:hypothetical protein